MTDYDQSLCACGAHGQITETGSASGRKHYRCSECGALWREKRDKNPAAVALGALGGKARTAALTPEERSRQSAQASEIRWDRIRAEKKSADNA
jgi:tRNA(Ile2) C34 agmatinyltransferase TiaS